MVSSTSILANILILVVAICLCYAIFFLPYILNKKRENLKSYVLSHKEELAFVILLFIGILSRCLLLDILPKGLNQDEASAGYDAFSILHYGKDRNNVTMPFHLIAWGSGQNALYSYVCIPLIWMFGLNVITLRLPMGIIGCVSLYLTYDLTLRLTGDKKKALFFMAFLLINPWHLMKSRWALEANLFPDLVFYGIYLFIRGYKEKKDHLFYLSSFILGLSAYSYGTSYFFLFFFVIITLIIFIFKYKLVYWKALIYLAIIGISVIPIILFIYVNVFDHEEIKILCFTVPKLTENRFKTVTNIFSSTFFEDSFKKFKQGLALIVTQNDNLPWNQINGIGTIYFISLPFALFGLLHKSENNKEITNIFRVCFGVTLAMTFILDSNINRLNIVFISLIYFTILGIGDLCTSLRSKKIVAGAYGTYFLVFISIYSSTWNKNISYSFYNGFAEAIRYADSLNEEGTIYTTSYVNMPYIYALFATEGNVDEFIETVDYANKGGAFQQVRSYGDFVFSLPISLSKNNIYIIEKWNNNYDRYDLSSYQVKEFGNYLVIDTHI